MDRTPSGHFPPPARSTIDREAPVSNGPSRMNEPQSPGFANFLARVASPLSTVFGMKARGRSNLSKSPVPPSEGGAAEVKMTSSSYLQNPLVAAEQAPAVPADTAKHVHVDISLANRTPEVIQRVLQDKATQGWSPKRLESLKFFLAERAPVSRPEVQPEGATLAHGKPQTYHRPYLGLKLLLETGPSGMGFEDQWSQSRLTGPSTKPQADKARFHPYSRSSQHAGRNPPRLLTASRPGSGAKSVFAANASVNSLKPPTSGLYKPQTALLEGDNTRVMQQLQHNNQTGTSSSVIGSKRQRGSPASMPLLGAGIKSLSEYKRQRLCVLPAAVSAPSSLLAGADFAPAVPQAAPVASAPARVEVNPVSVKPASPVPSETAQRMLRALESFSAKPPLPPKPATSVTPDAIKAANYVLGSPGHTPFPAAPPPLERLPSGSTQSTAEHVAVLVDKVVDPPPTTLFPLLSSPGVFVPPTPSFLATPLSVAAAAPSTLPTAALLPQPPVVSPFGSSKFYIFGEHKGNETAKQINESIAGIPATPLAKAPVYLFGQERNPATPSPTKLAAIREAVLTAAAIPLPDDETPWSEGPGSSVPTQHGHLLTPEADGSLPSFPGIVRFAPVTSGFQLPDPNSNTIGDKLSSGKGDLSMFGMQATSPAGFSAPFPAINGASTGFTFGMQDDSAQGNGRKRLKAKRGLGQ